MNNFTEQLFSENTNEKRVNNNFKVTTLKQD